MTDLVTLPQLDVEDIAITGSTISVFQRLVWLYRNAVVLQPYGKNPPPSLRDNVSFDLQTVSSREDIQALGVVSTKLWDLAEHISSNPQLITEAFNSSNANLSLKYRGFQIDNWHLGRENWLKIRAGAVNKVVGEFARPMTYSERDELGFQMFNGYDFFMVNQDRYKDTYLTDSSEPWLSRAAYLARRNQVVQMLDQTLGSRVVPVGDDKGKPLFFFEQRTGLVDYEKYAQIASTIGRIKNLTVSTKDLRAARNELHSLTMMRVSSDTHIRKQLGQEKFLAHWSNIKNAKQRIVNNMDVDKLMEEFSTIPILPSGSTTERTWGIEVETVRASRTSRPQGWEQKSDGSLEADDDDSYCDCDCTSCYDGEHCERESRDCNYADGNCAEFVSPILSHFNSNGLKRLCNDIPTHESNTSPGIHVHVGADGLTVTDVARLLYAYGVVERFLVPLYHRETTSYCKETPSNSVQWWLSAARRYLRDTGRVPRPADIAYEQPSDRYMDVNTQSLRQHGTIEFRSMGPYYDYEYLVRWAWFVRQMVVVSRLDIPQQVWNACNSLSDVIALLTKYGNESLSTNDDTTSVLDTIEE